MLDALHSQMCVWHKRYIYTKKLFLFFINKWVNVTCMHTYTYINFFYVHTYKYIYFIYVILYLLNIHMLRYTLYIQCERNTKNFTFFLRCSSGSSSIIIINNNNKRSTKDICTYISTTIRKLKNKKSAQNKQFNEHLMPLSMYVCMYVFMIIIIFAFRMNDVMLRVCDN